MLLQECMHLRPSDAPAGWHMWQDHSSAGRSNVAVLARDWVPVVSAGIRLIFDRDGDDLRPRYVYWIKLASGDVLASAHRPPYRDRAEWPAFDKALGMWAKQFAHVTSGMDSNESGKHATMLRRTGLTHWSGVGIDGFASRGAKVTGVHALPKLHSDHRPVAATLTLEK